MKEVTIRIGLLVLAATALLAWGCANPLNASLDYPGQAKSVSSPAPSAAETEEQPAVINEFVCNHAGTDTNEFIEVFADPDTAYTQLTLLEIEGDSTGAGTVDGVFALGTTGSSGFWTTAFLENELENGTVTLLLVEGFSGAAEEDLDADNDGAFDSTPWSAIVDGVAVSDGGSSDRVYSSVVLGPGFDGVSFTPGGASRIPNGADSDSVSDWLRNDYDGAGLPELTCTPDEGEALNTPGQENEPAGAPPIEATIMEIQGTGATSPLAGELVRTTGVVTLETAYGGSFWIQDTQGDGDPSTSDGIYVYQGDYVTDVRAGDLVEVTAFVKEYTASTSPTSLPLTELVSAKGIEVLASDQPLPAPVPLETLPDVSIPKAIEFWEALEGMLVSVDHGPVVAPTSSYGEFCLLTSRNARPGSGYEPLSGQILVRKIGPNDVDYNPERVLVDDGSLQEPLIVYPGDWVKHLVGVVDYSFGNYKLQPAEWDLQARWRPAGGAASRQDRRPDRRPGWSPGRPTGWSPGRPHGRRGEAAITTFNVENLFDLENEPGKDDEGSTPTPAQLEVKLSKLTLAIVEELELPELLVVQEIENQQILQTLGDRVNAVAGTSYIAVSFESSDVRGIEVGFLYDAEAVTLLDAYRMSGPDVESAFGSSSPSPGREPLVGVFEIAGLQITVVGNHFKSKGGDEPLFGLNWPPERPTELQRKAQARVVRTFVNGLLEANPRALVVVAGDLNDFQFAEPGEGPDHPLGILQGGPGEVRLTNVIDSIFRPLRFTYVYDGNSQVLDHLLISPAAKYLFAGAEILHFNASYPNSLSADPNTASQCSDHDPVELRLRRHHGWTYRPSGR